MKKNGFTLIEILLVIVILAAVSVTVGINMNSMFNNEKDKKYEAYISQIEQAACVYVEIENKTVTKTPIEIKKNDLLTKGLISKDLKNPKTQKKIEEDTTIEAVTVVLENNEKKCTIKTS